MDALVESTIQLLINWGYLGLFLSALLAGSVVPFSSELVLVALVEAGLNPTLCLLAAALGNTAGGMSCYYLGHCGKTEWINRFFKGKQERIEQIRLFLQGKGALMAFFSFLPFVGELIAIALGYMRSNILLTTTSMFIGKLARYIVMLLLMQGIINLFA